MSTTTETGEAYRAARLAVTPHLSQERLAEKAGISRRHYIRIEQGYNVPGARTRAQIAEVLGVDPDTLPVREAVSEDPFAEGRS